MSRFTIIDAIETRDTKERRVLYGIPLQVDEATTEMRHPGEATVYAISLYLGTHVCDHSPNGPMVQRAKDNLIRAIYGEVLDEFVQLMPDLQYQLSQLHDGPELLHRIERILKMMNGRDQ